MRVLGLDLGRRRVGVAISDPQGAIASPLAQLEPKGRLDLVAAVRRLVEEHGVERVVVGMPYLEDGTVGEEAHRAEGFAAALRAAISTPVVAWDERFTTAEAEEAMRQAGLRPDQRKARRDKVAATIMLQAYLNSGAPL